MLDGFVEFRIILCYLHDCLPCILCVTDILCRAEHESDFQLIEEIQCDDASECRLSVLSSDEHLHIPKA